MSFIVHSGWRQDPVGKAGTAHLVEHLTTKNVPGFSRRQLSEFFEEEGGSFFSGATKDFGTNYGCFLPIRGGMVARSLELWSSILLSAELTQRVEEERQAVLLERQENLSSEGQIRLHRRYVASLLAGTPLDGRGPELMGGPEIISGITAKDAQAFYDAHYTPANISIVTMGGLAPGTIVSMLEKSSLGGDKNGTRTLLPMFLADTPFPKERIFQVSHRELFGAESDGTASYRTHALIPGAFSDRAVAAAMDLLGEELFDKVRISRNWAYHIGASYERFGDFFDVGVRCGKLDYRGVDSIDALVSDVAKKVMKDAPSFMTKRARRLSARQLADVSGNSVILGCTEDILYHDRIISLREEIELIAALTFEEVQEVLAYFIDERRRWTCLVTPD
ncbi:MAG: insulinase family protein [Candidatus Spechtbacterales bacterium]